MRPRLLALLFFLTAWITLAHLLPHSGAATKPAADVSSEAQAGVPEGSGDSDARWIAEHRATASVAGSIWKSSAVHADLAAAPSGNAVAAADTVGRLDRPTPTRSAHLRHTPLLI